MTTFAFLICLTPEHLQTPLRRDLFSGMLASLKEQTSKNWTAYILGEEKGVDGNLVYLKTQAQFKNERLIEAVDWLEQNARGHEFLIRLDDDDIFSRTILSEIEALPEQYDCYCDTYHTYIDPVYLRISQKRNPWMANTVIHAYKHAIAPDKSNGRPVITQDHSISWHRYYADKRVLYFERERPLYYRILSPFTITSSDTNRHGQINWPKFRDYLRGYGPWRKLPHDLSISSRITKIKSDHFDKAPPLSFSERWIETLKNRWYHLFG